MQSYVFFTFLGLGVAWLYIVALFGLCLRTDRLVWVMLSAPSHLGPWNTGRVRSSDTFSDKTHAHFSLSSGWSVIVVWLGGLTELVDLFNRDANGGLNRASETQPLSIKSWPDGGFHTWKNGSWVYSVCCPTLQRTTRVCVCVCGGGGQQTWGAWSSKGEKELLASSLPRFTRSRTLKGHRFQAWQESRGRGRGMPYSKTSSTVKPI